MRQSWPPKPGGHLHCPSYGLHSPELPQLNAGRRQLKQGGHSGGREGSVGRRLGGTVRSSEPGTVISLRSSIPWLAANASVARRERERQRRGSHNRRIIVDGRCDECNCCAYNRISYRHCPRHQRYVTRGGGGHVDHRRPPYPALVSTVPTTGIYNTDNAQGSLYPALPHLGSVLQSAPCPSGPTVTRRFTAGRGPYHCAPCTPGKGCFAVDRSQYCAVCYELQWKHKELIHVARQR